MIKTLSLKLVAMSEDQYNKNIFAKGYVPNWSEQNILIEKVTNTAS